MTRAIAILAQYGADFSKRCVDTSCSYLQYRYLFILGSAVVSPAKRTPQIQFCYMLRRSGRLCVCVCVCVCVVCVCVWYACVECACACVVCVPACVNQHLSAFWSNKFISALYEDLFLPHSFLMSVATVFTTLPLSITCMIHYTPLYDTLHSAVWYTTLRCVIHYTPLWYTTLRCVIHYTPLCDTLHSAVIYYTPLCDTLHSVRRITVATVGTAIQTETQVSQLLQHSYPTRN